MRTKTDFRTSIALIALLISMVGCNSSDKQMSNTIEFENYKIDTTYYISTKPNDTIGCTFTLNMEYPSTGSNQAIADSVKKLFTSDYFGDKYAGLSPVVAANTFMKEYIENYKVVAADLIRAFGDTPSLNYEEASNSEIRYNEQSFLCYTIYKYSYTGGAHGMQSNENHVIWLKDASRITLKDIINESKYEEVGKLIIRQIAKDRGVRNPIELNDEGFFSIEEVMPNENFIIDANGVTWTYNPYEISAYYIGETNVTLNWSSLYPYLNHLSPVIELAQPE